MPSRWEEYLMDMGKEGTWAGHMELQATSQVAVVNITVHQVGQPAWTIRNFPQVSPHHVRRVPCCYPRLLQNVLSPLQTCSDSVSRMSIQRG